MRALTLAGSKIHLSMNYDGLTLYPQFKVDQDGPMVIIMTIRECVDKGLVLEPMFVPAKITKEGMEFEKGCQAIEKENMYGFKRFIHRDDDDHAFYHKDEFSEEKTHYHLKFNHMLNPIMCNEMLTIFVNHDLLTEKEKQSFIQQLNDRYNFSKIQVRDQLKGNKEQDLLTISQFVKSCGDNDILAHLHDYLAGPEFNYLRSDFGWSKWNSLVNFQTSNQGSLEKTSYEWAMIEKGIALQMAKNVEVNTKYTPNVAYERSAQLREDQPFFAIKRKASLAQTSKMFQEFQQHYTNDFHQSYDNHMKRFTK